VEGVIGAKEGSELSPGFESLLMSFGCKMDAVIWHSLMDIAILVSLRLSMPYEDDQLGEKSQTADLLVRIIAKVAIHFELLTLGFPILQPLNNENRLQLL
jgi:hypothetical protein